MKRSSKVILEDIDEAELQVDRYAVVCRGILNEATEEKREPTAEQTRRFDANCERITETKNRLSQLRNELNQADEHKRQIVMNSRHPSAAIYGNQFQGDTVLPVNGVLPGDEQRIYPQHVSMTRLKAFRNEHEALDGGRWFQAVVARVFRDSVDPVAEAHCERVGIQITNTAYEGSGPAGGYLLPAPVSSAIIEVRERVGVARRVCSVRPTTGDTLSTPKKTGGLTVYYPAETASITASDKAWGSVNNAIEKRAVLAKISQELSEDALINIVDNVFSEMGYALALQEDNELINGTGASTYGHVRGLLSSIGAAGVSTAATGHDTWAELDLADMAAAIGKLPDRFHVYDPCWVVSHSFYVQVMMRLAFAAGGATMAEVLGATPSSRSFLGYPVFATPWMPTATATATKCALFGSFSQAVILADRSGVRLSRSDDWKFDEDIIALKGTSRYDINVHEPGDASNAGAYIALATAS